MKHCPSSVHNLTETVIPPAVQICMLLGLKFNFDLKPDFKKLYYSIAEGIRKYSWRVFFSNRGEDTNIDELTNVCIKIKKSVSTSKINCPIEAVLFGKNFSHDCVKKLKRIKKTSNPIHDYLVKQLQLFLLQHDVVIKPSDKNAGLVVMKRDDYESEIMRQLTDLGTYIPITSAQFNIALHNFKDKVAHFNNVFFSSLKINLKSIVPKEAKPANFYILPKIHKKYEIFPVGRPICSNVCTINRGIAILLDAILKPLTVHIPNLLIDTPHLLTLLDNITLEEGRKYYLIAADIQAMYQELPINSCKANCLLFFQRYKNVTNFPFEVTERQLSLLLDLSLDYSYIQFKSELFFQKRGIQMGNNSSVSVANITAAVELEDLWKQEMIFRRRFIDDVLVILDVTDFTVNVTEWINESFKHTFLKFTVESSDKQVNFLDLNIRLNDNNTITTSIYSKPMSKHEYLHFHSNHPPHMKKSLPFSCGLRVIRTCSEVSDRVENLNAMFSKFLRRNYPQSLLEETKANLLQLDRKLLIQPSSSFHKQHLQLHNNDIILTDNIPSVHVENNKVFIVIPFHKIPNLKHVMHESVLQAINKCNSVRLKSLAMNFDVNLAFTIPNQTNNIIAAIEKKKESQNEQSGG